MDIIFIIISYLIGSVPFSWIIAKKFAGIELWEEGEGNVGARNVYHLMGLKYGFAAGFADFSKGFAVALMGKALSLSVPLIWLSGLVALAGHQFPIYLRFKGGKGAALAFGFLTFLFPMPMLLAFMVMAVLKLFKAGFHLTISAGFATLPILWMPIFKYSITDSVLVIIFLLVPGVKRILDQSHMKEVRARTGWKHE
ncbi:MAG: glycerol-3-phosphate acyltransferase [Fidelibacterota bacterium]